MLLFDTLSLYGIFPATFFSNASGTLHLFGKMIFFDDLGFISGLPFSFISIHSLKRILLYDSNNRNNLPQQYHLFCFKKTVCTQLIKINSTSEITTVKLNSIMSGRLHFINKLGNFLSKYIIHF